jgi:hypothetical protein
MLIREVTMKVIRFCNVTRRHIQDEGILNFELSSKALCPAVLGFKPLSRPARDGKIWSGCLATILVCIKISKKVQRNQVDARTQLMGDVCWRGTRENILAHCFFLLHFTTHTENFTNLLRKKLTQCKFQLD